MKIHESMLNVFSMKDSESSKIEARKNNTMNGIQAKISKPMSKDNLFTNLLAEKLKKLQFKTNLQGKKKIYNIMFKHSMMFHNSGKQPVQAHQFNVFSNQMSPLPATPSTPTPSCTNNTAINLPATPEFANNQINFLQLQTQGSQSQYIVEKAFLQYMQSKHVQ